jgi:hypothetical protein
LPKINLLGADDVVNHPAGCAAAERHRPGTLAGAGQLNILAGSRRIDHDVEHVQDMRGHLPVGAVWTAGADGVRCTPFRILPHTTTLDREIQCAYLKKCLGVTLG